MVVETNNNLVGANSNPKWKMASYKPWAHQTQMEEPKIPPA